MEVLRLEIGGRIYEAHPVLVPGETMVHGSVMLERAKAVVGDWATEDDFNWILDHLEEANALQDCQLLFLAWVHPGMYSITTIVFSSSGTMSTSWSSPSGYYVQADRILVRRPAIEHHCEWIHNDCVDTDAAVDVDATTVCELG